MAVRIPFILIGLGIVFLTYRLGGWWAGFAAGSSTLLIFLSKVPNEAIVLTFLFTLLYIVVSRPVINIKIFLALLGLLVLVSKTAWFLIPVFVIFAAGKIRFKLFLISGIFCAAALIIFLQIPQGWRSLQENNFQGFAAASIQNGIDRLRGQGIQSGWPPVAEKIFFNKSWFLTAGIFNWFSSFSPGILFGPLDNMGVWPKAAIIPFILGLFRAKSLIGLSLIMTLPFLFTYPDIDKSMLVASVPFMALIVAAGFKSLKTFFKILVAGALMFELIINLLNPVSLRPTWIKQIAYDAYELSLKNNVVVSDDIISDITPFLYWHTPLLPGENLKQPFPYKIRQTEIGDNLKVVGWENTFYICGADKPTSIIASRRDLKKIQIDHRITYEKQYKNDQGEVAAFLMPDKICVH